jgi:hypothetical protein
MKDKLELTDQQLQDLIRQVSRHVIGAVAAAQKVGGKPGPLLDILHSRSNYAVGDDGRLRVTYRDKDGTEMLAFRDGSLQPAQPEDVFAAVKAAGQFPTIFSDSPEASDPSATPSADTPKLSPIERLKTFHRQQAAKTR